VVGDGSLSKQKNSLDRGFDVLHFCKAGRGCLSGFLGDKWALTGLSSYIGRCIYYTDAICIRRIPKPPFPAFPSFPPPTSNTHHNARVLIPPEHRILSAARLRIPDIGPAPQEFLMAHHACQLACDGAVDVFDDAEIGREEDVEVALLDLVGC